MRILVDYNGWRKEYEITGEQFRIGHIRVAIQKPFEVSPCQEKNRPTAWVRDAMRDDSVQDKLPVFVIR